MISTAEILELSRSILGAESSERSGTEMLGAVLKRTFQSFPWKETQSHGGSSVFYFETMEQSDHIDLLCYVNADTTNPSQLSLWTETDFDPLAITFKKGRVYGLGAAHEKMTLVPLCLSIQNKIEELKDAGLNIMVAVGYGREAKMRGARRLMTEVIQNKKVSKVCVAHPTQSETLYGSAGRLKTKVFYPFSEDEKKVRSQHDLRENISSQSKVYSYNGDETLKGNTIFQMIESCSHLPSGAVLLDLEGGLSHISQPETTYFELDLTTPFEGSMILKFANFSEILMKLDQELTERFNSREIKKSLHIGKVSDSEEGVTFLGYNLIPAFTKQNDLDAWFEQFQKAVLEVGGELTIVDAKGPYINPKYNEAASKNCLNVTEASVFSKHCEDIIILGPGIDGMAKKPNESISIEALKRSCGVYESLFSSLRGE
jgi:hypothetical protein